MLRILFVQDSSPCIRNIKYAEALNSAGVNVHLLYKNKSPDDSYGYGNSNYASMNKFRYRFQAVKTAKDLIKKHDISLIHYHNQPDILCAKLLKSELQIPVIWDCHDLLSFKHRLSRTEKNAEKRCCEQSAGVIFPSQSYLIQTSKKYVLSEANLAFGNYYPAKNLLDASEYKKKLHDNDNLVHIVFQGRLAEKKSDHRYIVEKLKLFSPSKYVIHIYPSNNKEFTEYGKIPNVVIHQKLPYSELIREISAFDFGLVVFNDATTAQLDIVKHSFGNKIYDYLCAGLPIVAQDALSDISEFVKSNEIGLLLSKLETLNYEKEYSILAENVIRQRTQYSMEAKIKDLIGFYDMVVRNFHAK